MRITVALSITVEENDGDANTFAMTKVSNTGDNPLYVTQACREVVNPTVTELLGRVDQTYGNLR